MGANRQESNQHLRKVRRLLGGLKQLKFLPKSTADDERWYANSLWQIKKILNGSQVSFRWGKLLLRSKYLFHKG